MSEVAADHVQGEIDPGLADFLQAANDAHCYRKALLATGHKVSPDMPTALALLGEPGDDAVFASDSGTERPRTVMAGDTD